MLLRLYLFRLTGTQVESSWHCILIFFSGGYTSCLQCTRGVYYFYSFWRLYLFTVLLRLYLCRLTPKMIPINQWPMDGPLHIAHCLLSTQPLQVCKTDTRHLRCQLAIVPPPQPPTVSVLYLRQRPLFSQATYVLCPPNLSPPVSLPSGFCKVCVSTSTLTDISKSHEKQVPMQLYLW